MKVNHALPRHRHLSLQRMCRRHSRFTLHAGLITVSDSQTAPRTLKMSLWNLRVCKLTIIPSVFRKKNQSGGEKGVFRLLWSTDEGGFKKSPCAAYLHFWRGGEPDFQMKASQPHTGQLCTPACREAGCLYCLCKLKKKWVKTKWEKESRQFEWDCMTTPLPDSGQVAPRSCQGDHIKADSPAPFPDLLRVKAFSSHSWWH